MAKACCKKKYVPRDLVATYSITDGADGDSFGFNGYNGGYNGNYGGSASLVSGDNLNLVLFGSAKREDRNFALLMTGDFASGYGDVEIRDSSNTLVATIPSVSSNQFGWAYDNINNWTSFDWSNLSIAYFNDYFAGDNSVETFTITIKV